MAGFFPRKIFRDACCGITKPAIQRLVKRIDNECRICGIVYEEMRGATKFWLEKVLRVATIFMRKSISTRQPNRIRVAHILAALKHVRGKNVKTHHCAVLKRFAWCPLQKSCVTSCTTAFPHRN